MAPSRRTDAALGAAAGLLAGVALAVIILGQGRLDSSAPLRLDETAIGWLSHLALAILGGGAYGALYRFQPGGLAATVGGGLLFGLLWWATVWLTAVPFVTGTGPGWSVQEATGAFPRLIASVLFGGLTALVFHALGSRFVTARATTTPRAAESIAVSHRIVILGGGFGGVATAQRLEQLLAHRPVGMTTSFGPTVIIRTGPTLDRFD